MFAVTSTAKLGIDSEHFKSAVTISNAKNVEHRKDHCGDNKNDPRTLHLVRVKGFPRLLPEGNSKTAWYHRCRSLYIITDKKLSLRFHKLHIHELKKIHRYFRHPRFGRLLSMASRIIFIICPAERRAALSVMLSKANPLGNSASGGISRSKASSAY